MKLTFKSTIRILEKGIEKRNKKNKYKKYAKKSEFVLQILHAAEKEECRERNRRDTFTFKNLAHCMKSKCKAKGERKIKIIAQNAVTISNY